MVLDKVWCSLILETRRRIKIFNFGGFFLFNLEEVAGRRDYLILRAFTR